METIMSVETDFDHEAAGAGNRIEVIGPDNLNGRDQQLQHTTCILHLVAKHQF